MKKAILSFIMIVCIFQSYPAEAQSPHNQSKALNENVLSSSLKVGWSFENDHWYYFSNNVMHTGWLLIGNNWYYMGVDGVLSIGWFMENNKWYYSNQNGEMQAGWLSERGIWYYLGQLGDMKTGWINDQNKFYFLDETGAMKTGWQLYQSKWYYLGSDGVMKTGWVSSNGKWYYLHPNGEMALGWFQVGTKSYYAYSNGVLAENTTIDGYRIGYSGAWIPQTSTFYYINGILLVNKNHSLPANYDPGVNADAKAAFEQMKSGALASGLTIKPVSVYRSYYYQNDLYNRFVRQYGQAEADRFSAKPGYSEHQTGLAYDIGGSNSSNWANDGFNNTAEAKWLADNAYQYGFILRYPSGKEHLTGYMYESWHYRYLGVDLATIVYLSGLTLEEYLGEY